MTLTRRAAQEAVNDLGWRYILGTLRATVAVPGLARAAEAAARCTAAAGPNADGHLALDLRAGRLTLTVQTFAENRLTPADLAVVERVTAALAELDLAAVPAQTQLLEIAIDALDIPAVRPFWKAALAYVDPPEGPDAYGAPLLDPLLAAPAVWFQQMDAPRPQRNRIHLDISVPHDEAGARVRAALEAGGTLVSDARAPAFWVLADAEGNEACITTWQGRD